MSCSNINQRQTQNWHKLSKSNILIKEKELQWSESDVDAK